MGLEYNVDFEEIVVIEVPLDKLEEWGVNCADVASVDYDKLMEAKTGEWDNLRSLMKLLNTSADFSNVETSIYVMVNKIGRRVIQ